MYQKDNRGKGYFRKSKAYGLVCGISLASFLFMGAQVAQADEVVVETSPKSELVTGNPSTNLTEAQAPAPEANTKLATQAGNQSGTITAPVTSSELNNAVDNAKDAGVTVTEVDNKVVHENIESAQADLSSQIKDVKIASEKQEANTVVIKEAVEKNADIDRQNEAEKKRVEEANKKGQEAVDIRNTNGQKAVEERNRLEAEAVAERNKKGQEAVDARNAQRKADEDNRKAYIEKRNAEGQANVDSQNEAEKKRVDVENARLKTEYEAELAKIEVVEIYNAEVRKRNAEAVAKVEAENKQRLADYEAQKAEMQAKTKEEGYLSEVVAQGLIYTSEPNVIIRSIEGVTKFVNPEKRKEVSNSNRNLIHTVSSYSEGDYVGTVDYSNGTTFLLNLGQTATVTYTGDFSASANGEKITKVVARYTVVASEKGASIVTVSKDPTETVIFGSDATQGFVGIGDELRIEKTFYTASGKVVATKESPIIFSISSMNSLGEDSYFEFVKDLSSNMRFVPITGSQVQNHSGKVYASLAIDSIEPYNGHDSVTSPVRYYGSGALVAESGDIFGLTVGASKHQTGHWFALNTKVAAPTVPIPPRVEYVKPELEKEVPPTPANPKYVEPKVIEFVPEPYIPRAIVPEVFTPENPRVETFIPEKYTPIKPVVLPHVQVPEKETYSVSVHPVLVKQTPDNVKAVVNEDGISVDGHLVPKGSVQTWVLTNTNLKAGRPVTTSYVIIDPLPAGFELDLKATAEKNTAWVFSYDNGSVLLTATEGTLNSLNANLNQDVVIPLAYLVGRPVNDGGTYKNTFVTKVGTPSGVYTTVSNIPVIYTPGRDPKDPRPPHPGTEEPPTPFDNLIEPRKDVVDGKGNSINGQSVLPNSTLNYVAIQDFDQYKGIVASQTAIAKGFVYVDDYLDKALDGQSMIVNSITAKNGDDVSKLLDMYHVLSKDSLDDKLQVLIKESGITPVGEFYLWVAKDPQAFYNAYVSKGLDITYNVSFKVKDTFIGKVTNQTFQIDFGNGYYGNIVENDVPEMKVNKDVNIDGKAVDKGTIKLGDTFTYTLEGWVIPSGRGYDIDEYRFVDIMQSSHDEYKGFKVTAKVDIILSDGTKIAKGTDLSSYVVQSYNINTGTFELKFKEEFLSQVPRTSEFGSDVILEAKRVKSGTVENEFTLYVNGIPVKSDKVVTETPEPPKPPQPTPPAPAIPSKVELPKTGTEASYLLSFTGIVALFVGLFGLRKKEEK